MTTSDGLTLSAMEHGDPAGPEILFVHGLGQSRLSWSRQVGGPLADTHRIITYDLRGHGASDKPSTPDAYADAAVWAADLHAVREAANLTNPVLVGWSLGALVIGHYLLRRGDDRVAGLNLVGAVTKLDPELLGPAALHYRDLVVSPDLAIRSAAIAGFLEECFVVPPPAEDLHPNLVVNGMVPVCVHHGLRHIGSEGLDEAWASIPHLLATHGALDRHAKPEMSRRLLGLNPAARVSVYEDAGHAPFLEQPVRFNRELAAFVAGCEDLS